MHETHCAHHPIDTILPTKPIVMQEQRFIKPTFAGARKGSAPRLEAPLFEGATAMVIMRR